MEPGVDFHDLHTQHTLSDGEQYSERAVMGGRALQGWAASIAVFVSHQ